MLVDKVGRDVDVVQLETGQFGLVGVASGVEPSSQQIDDLDPSLVSGAVLEQLLFARPDRAILHRLLHHLKAGGDFVGVGGCAVPPEHELADVGRNGVLAAELLGEVLLDEIAVEGVRLLSAYLAAARRDKGAGVDALAPFTEDAVDELWTHSTKKPRDLLRKAHKMITYAAEENLESIDAAAVESHLTLLTAGDDEVITDRPPTISIAAPDFSNE